MSNPSPEPKEELDRILQSARRLGVEMDEADALQWLTAMSAGPGTERRTRPHPSVRPAIGRGNG